MNDPLPEFDPKLAARFRDTHAHIADEPFVGAALKRVAADRARSTVTRRAWQIAALVAVIAASPWLIRGSVLLSELLERVFAVASEWLASPPGMAIGALAGVALAALYRLRSWRVGR
jgi:hypothetical protein